MSTTFQAANSSSGTPMSCCTRALSCATVSSAPRHMMKGSEKGNASRFPAGPPSLSWTCSVRGSKKGGGWVRYYAHADNLDVASAKKMQQDA